jgi:hypothetical protein
MNMDLAVHHHTHGGGHENPYYGPLSIRMLVRRTSWHIVRVHASRISQVSLQKERGVVRLSGIATTWLAAGLCHPESGACQLDDRALAT